MSWGISGGCLIFVFLLGNIIIFFLFLIIFNIVEIIFDSVVILGKGFGILNFGVWYVWWNVFVFY